MKRVLLTLALGLAQLSFAQTEEQYINLVKDALKLELKEHIYTQLHLDETEQKAFNPVFDQYLKAQGKIAIAKWNNIDEYLKLKNQYSSEKLDALNKHIWKANSAQVALNKKFYNKFKKVIGTEKTTLFFLTKRYFDNAIEYRKLELLNL